MAESILLRTIGISGLLSLVALGSITLLIPALKTLSFINFYFLRSLSLKTYLSNDPDRPAYALVTGATDGIGKAIAAELAEKGFDIVLHGRNEKKLESIKADLQHRFHARTFLTLVFDASNDIGDTAKLERTVGKLATINLKILVNNVGGFGPVVDPSFRSIFDISLSDINAQLDLNVRFTILLTKLLMPQLRQPEPTLILNIGSAASEMPGVYQTTYSGAKGFLKTWSNALNDESTAEGWNIRSSLLITGPVITEALASQGMKPSLTQPTPATYAKAVVNTAGCGHPIYCPYWAHRALLALILQLPRSLQISAIKGMAKDLMRKKDQ